MKFGFTGVEKAAANRNPTISLCVTILHLHARARSARLRAALLRPALLPSPHHWPPCLAWLCALLPRPPPPASSGRRHRGCVASLLSVLHRAPVPFRLRPRPTGGPEADHLSLPATFAGFRTISPTSYSPERRRGNGWRPSSRQSH